MQAQVHTAPPGKALTREQEPEGDVGLRQQGLHVAPEELQGLALAAARVEQHEHAAGPGEQVLGAAGCKNTPEKAASSTGH